MKYKEFCFKKARALTAVYYGARKVFPQFFLMSYITKFYRAARHDKLNLNYKLKTDSEKMINLNSQIYSKHFMSHDSLASQKWEHYLEVYDQVVNHLQSRFDNEVTILEIGVQNGGSIQIWRKIFGKNANIFGIDIDKNCAKLNIDAEIRIGSSNDKGFLGRIGREAAKFHLIVDDGSHKTSHQKIALETLFPYLSEGGLYIIEDLEHSYYWLKGGGYLRPGSFIQTAKRLIDLLNKDYFNSPVLPTFGIDHELVKSISFFKGMIILEKGEKIHPKIVWTGKKA